MLCKRLPEPLQVALWVCCVVAILACLFIAMMLWMKTTRDSRHIDGVQHLSYVKDHRTGLCFAGHDSSLAEVDCEKVQKYLLNP